MQIVENQRSYPRAINYFADAEPVNLVLRGILLG
jgi:hypothetical protein